MSGSTGVSKNRKLGPGVVGGPAATAPYVTRMAQESRSLTEADIERIIRAIVAGVLARVKQIAESGAQIGRA